VTPNEFELNINAN